MIARALLVTVGATATLISSALAEVPDQPKPATEQTATSNHAVLGQLPFSDRQDYEDASRGFIAALPGGAIKAPDGSFVWNLNAYDFLKGDKAPNTVNPSLWRIAQLNMNNGLFQVADRIYQLRGFDLSNITVIEGDTGIIVVDPLVTKEAAKAAMVSILSIDRKNRSSL